MPDSSEDIDLMASLPEANVLKLSPEIEHVQRLVDQVTAYKKQFGLSEEIRRLVNPLPQITAIEDSMRKCRPRSLC